MRTSTKLTFALAMLTMAMPALADDESDRVRYVEDYLARVKDKLDGIAGKSSADDINNAFDYLDKIKEQVEKLKSMGPKNEPGITMANNYLDYISKFREAAKNLKYMKEAQLAQEKDQMAERCNDATAKFRSDLAAFVDRKDPNGLNKIPDIAERVARDYGDALSRMEDKHREMDHWKGDARSFSESNGKWSDVRSKLSDGANEIWERWNRRMEDSRKKCQVLAKGKDSDLAKDAIAKLNGAGTTRVAIRRAIDEKLQLIASKLKDLDTVSNDGASQIQDAQRGVDEVLALLDQLKREQGEDSEAKQIADRWPDQAKSLRDAINSYKMLKAGQNYLDPDLRNCQAELGSQKDFLAQKTSLSGRNDPASPDQIRSNAADIQKSWQARSENAAAMGRNLANYSEKAAAFSFRDGAWSAVADALQKSAGKSFSYYNSSRARVYDSDPCRQLQLGTSSPDVDAALRALGEHRGTIGRRYEALRQAFKKFQSDASIFRTTDEQTSAEIRDAICNDREWESKVPRIADDKVSQFRSQWDRLQAQRDQMLNEIDQLIKDSRDKALPEFKRRIVDYLNPLGPIFDNATKGSANPKIRAYLDFGKDEHKRIQAASCPMSEVVLPSGKKIDCIRSCILVEIKPNNPAETKAGGEQVLGYRDELVRVFNQDPQAFLNRYPPLSRCLQPQNPAAGQTQQLIFDMFVQTYSFCPSNASLFFSSKEPSMNWEPPDKIDQ